MSRDLEKARQDGERADKFTEGALRVTNECTKLRWSSALQRIAACLPARIQLQDIRLRHVGSTGDAWSLCIACRCSGTRLDANAFRDDIQKELGTIFDGRVNAQLDETEKAPSDAAAGSDFTFVIVAAVSAETPKADAARRNAK